MAPLPQVAAEAEEKAGSAEPRPDHSVHRVGLRQVYQARPGRPAHWVAAGSCSDADLPVPCRAVALQRAALVVSPPEVAVGAEAEMSGAAAQSQPVAEGAATAAALPVAEEEA